MPHAKSKQTSKSKKSIAVSKSISKKNPPGSMLSRWNMDAEMEKKSSAPKSDEQKPMTARWMDDNVGPAKLKKTKKRKANAKFLAAGNAWRAHVKETMRKNPNMKFGKELLRLAKKTYKKGSTSNNSGAVNITTSRYSVQVRPKAKKTKRAKKRTSRKKRTGFFGL